MRNKEETNIKTNPVWITDPTVAEMEAFCSSVATAIGERPAVVGSTKNGKLVALVNGNLGTIDTSALAVGELKAVFTDKDGNLSLQSGSAGSEDAIARAAVATLNDGTQVFAGKTFTQKAELKHSHAVATPTQAGFLSSDDKIRIDTIPVPGSILSYNGDFAVQNKVAKTGTAMHNTEFIGGWVASEDCGTFDGISLQDNSYVATFTPSGLAPTISQTRSLAVLSSRPESVYAFATISSPAACTGTAVYGNGTSEYRTVFNISAGRKTYAVNIPFTGGIASAFAGFKLSVNLVTVAGQVSLSHVQFSSGSCYLLQTTSAAQNEMLPILPDFKVQRFLAADTDGFFKWLQMSSTFIYKFDFISTQSYTVGDAVTHVGNLYYCLVSVGPGSDPITDTEHWKAMTSTGTGGADAQARSAIARLQGTPLYSDAPAITLAQTKTVTDNLGNSLSLKANSADVYTKEQTYTKNEINTYLNAKANAAEVYTSRVVDTLLSAKANASNVYSKTEVDTALASKAAISVVKDNLKAGENITLAVQGQQVTISATGGGSSDLLYQPNATDLPELWIKANENGITAKKDAADHCTITLPTATARVKSVRNRFIADNTSKMYTITITYNGGPQVPVAQWFPPTFSVLNVANKILMSNAQLKHDIASPTNYTYSNFTGSIDYLTTLNL